MKNLEHLKYTYNHRIAFRFILKEFIEKGLLSKQEAVALEYRAKYHDLDKAFLYTMIDKPLASRYHKLTSPHHIRKENPTHGRPYDYIEAIIDYESAHYTKADKPLNAFDTIKMVPWMGEKDKDRMLLLCETYGIDHSYKRDPEDPKWQDFYRNFIEQHPATEENILSEINQYLADSLLSEDPGLVYRGRINNVLVDLGLPTSDIASIDPKDVEAAVDNKIWAIEGID